MRGNRGLVIVALVLIVLALLAGGAYLLLSNGGSGVGLPGQGEAEPTMEAAPVETTDIVVAIQDIPVGMEISVENNAVALQEWPNENLPLQYFTSLEEVDGKYARMEIARGLPVMPNMIGRPGGMLSVSGSAAALFEPDDRVAYAIPLDTQGSVAWAIKPGDRVDVLAALNMVPVSSEFATEGIKQFTYLEEPELPSQTSLYGRFELLPNGRWAAIYTVDATTNLEPALMVQMTVQDAIVWHVGLWEDETEDVQPAVETGGDAGGAGGAAPLGGGGQQPPATPVPVPQTRDIELVTLLVSREDALILKYLYEIGADMDLVLRPAGVTGTVLQTQPVLFRYVLDKYQLPSTMPDDPVGPTPLQPPLRITPEATPEVSE
ncbi:MAG: Flp pilus assembly protein CpaB [Anaerolineae bacterium]